MLDKLSGVLKKTTDKIANAVFLDKTVVDAIVRDLQRALIEADVNVSLVMEISKRLKQVAYDERIKGVEKKEHLIKALHDELIGILGTKREIVLGKHNRFMLVGLYGSGKTTTTGKLALYYAKRGHKVCAVGLDVHRPAAAEQLRQVCEKVKIPCFIEPGEKNALKIWKKYEKEIEKYDLVLVDTAGRDALDDGLIEEIRGIAKAVQPQEVFLVLPADIGQTAKKQAQVFKEAAKVSGVIITRMDSTAKAGGALTACAEVKSPVLFIGTGEKPHDIEQFNPEQFLSRLLGMGDLAGLIEKVQSAVGNEKIEKTQKRLEEGKFSLVDFRDQLDSMGEMGGFDKLMHMVPGLGKAAEKMPEGQLESQQEKMKKWKYAIDSMTMDEKENPELLEKQTSRIQRVAKGAGTTTTEVRALIKQFKMLKDMLGTQMNGQGNPMDQKTMMKFAKKYARKMKM